MTVMSLDSRGLWLSLAPLALQGCFQGEGYLVQSQRLAVLSTRTFGRCLSLPKHPMPALDMPPNRKVKKAPPLHEAGAGREGSMAGGGGEPRTRASDTSSQGDTAL